MKDIILVFSGLIIGLIIWLLKTIIANQLKQKITTQTEKFDTNKLVNGLTSVVRTDLWGKTINQELSIRTWMIRLALIGIIVGVIYGWGWYKGRMGAPVAINLQGKEATIKLNEHFLRIEKDGSTKVVDKQGKVLKTIRVKDIPELERALRPYGFIFEPVVVGGLGIGNSSSGIEGGVGLRYTKWFKWYADVCLTNKGAYPLGVSYKLTENTAIGISAGTGFKKNERGLFERILTKITIKW